LVAKIVPGAKRRDLADRKKELVTELRRGEILEAAARVFGARGFADARVDDIAAEAGLTKATLYAYFPSKDAIYESVMDQAFGELSERTMQRVSASETLAEKLRGYMTVRLAYWDEKQVLYRVIWSTHADPRNRERATAWHKLSVEFLTKLMQQAARRGEIPKQDFELAAWRVVDMMRGLYDRHLNGEETRPLEEGIAAMVEFVVRGLGCRKS